MAGWHKSYIWSGLVARMIIDLQEYQSAVGENLVSNEKSKGFYLAQNYPNPFNQETIIKYIVPVSGDGIGVNLKIIDLLGREVRTLVYRPQSTGIHIIRWDGKDNNGQDCCSGVYLYRLKTKDFSINKKLILLR